MRTRLIAAAAALLLTGAGSTPAAQKPAAGSKPSAGSVVVYKSPT